jgi:hypothetical protein
VGAGYSPSRGDEAFIWTAQTGALSLTDLLTDTYHVDLTGWRLIRALSVSADGRAITGVGLSPEQHPEAFVVYIPAPAPAALLAVFVAGCLARRQDSRVR